MKKPLQLLRLFSLSLLGCFFACEEPVMLDIEEVMPQVVVNGVFTSHQPFQIVLTKSNPLFTDAATQFIDNAKVSILGEDDKVLGVLNYQKDALLPHYQLKQLSPTTETFYQLSIEIPGYATVSSIDYLPKPVPLKNIAVDTIVVGTDTPINSIAVSTTFKDPSEQKNFYHLRLYHELVSGRQSDGFQGNKEAHLMSFPITSIPENSLKATFDIDQVGILFSDDAINGKVVNLNLIAQLNELEAGKFPKIIGELRTVSENYYQYHTTIARQEESKDRPFAEPVSVFSNIENGVGVFAGFSSYRDSVIIVQ